jgi:hypothetical protein
MRQGGRCADSGHSWGDDRSAYAVLISSDANVARAPTSTAPSGVHGVSRKCRGRRRQPTTLPWEELEASRAPDQLPTIRIFISSPADVRPERLKAEQIVARLNSEFAYHFRVEAVLWEREPLVATHHFQDERNIPQPRSMGVVVVILWSMLGLLLPEDKFSGALSKRPVTATEWEFEDALASARTHAPEQRQPAGGMAMHILEV